MITRSFQFGGAGQQCRFKLLGVVNGVSQRGSAKRVEIAPCGIHHDQPLLSKEASHQTGEGAAKRSGFSGGSGLGVTLAQEIADGRIPQQVAGLGKQPIDCVAERQIADRCSLVLRLDAEAQRLNRGFRQQRNLIDLLEIVVLGGQPENGDVLRAGCSGRLFSPGDGGRYLEQCQQRPTKQSHLLSGDHGRGAGAKFGDVGQGCRSGAEPDALPFQRVCQCDSVGGRIGSGLHPRAAQRLGSVPRPQRRTGVTIAHSEIVAIEPGDVRQRRDGITLSAHQNPQTKAGISTRRWVRKLDANLLSIGTCLQLDALFSTPMQDDTVDP